MIPTGSLSLDNALGVGGLPRGRVVEVRQEARVAPLEAFEKSSRGVAKERTNINAERNYSRLTTMITSYTLKSDRQYAGLSSRQRIRLRGISEMHPLAHRRRPGVFRAFRLGVWPRELGEDDCGSAHRRAMPEDG